MKARSIYARVLRTYWRRAGYLLALGALIFVPLGLIDALANQLADVEPDKISDFHAVALGVGVVAQTATTLLGEVFYSGAVALALARGEESQPLPLKEVARRLAYGRLIAVDILFGVGAALGIIAFVVPGIVFFTWFALAGPVVELEGAGVKDAFARSRRLVRGRFWLVFWTLLPITIAAPALAAGLGEGVHLVIHPELLSDWVGEAVGNVLTWPFYAVAAVLLTMELSGRRR